MKKEERGEGGGWRVAADGGGGGDGWLAWVSAIVFSKVRKRPVIFSSRFDSNTSE